MVAEGAVEIVKKEGDNDEELSGRVGGVLEEERTDGNFCWFCEDTTGDCAFVCSKEISCLIFVADCVCFVPCFE